MREYCKVGKMDAGNNCTSYIMLEIHIFQRKEEFSTVLEIPLSVFVRDFHVVDHFLFINLRVLISVEGDVRYGKPL